MSYCKMNRLGLLLIATSLFSSCNISYDSSNIENYNDVDTAAIIQSFYNEYAKDTNFSHFQKVILINEHGSCLNCNNLFSLEHENEVNSDSVLFIISSYGCRIDISKYITNPHDNVIWDSLCLLDELLLFEKCEILDL